MSDLSLRDYNRAALDAHVAAAPAATGPASR